MVAATAITKTGIICTPPYPNKFKPGDKAKAKINVKFTSNNTQHNIGDEILVTEQTKAYFNVHYQHYDLVEG